MAGSARGSVEPHPASSRAGHASPRALHRERRGHASWRPRRWGALQDQVLPTNSCRGAITPGRITLRMNAKPPAATPSHTRPRVSPGTEAHEITRCGHRQWHNSQATTTRAAERGRLHGQKEGQQGTDTRHPAGQIVSSRKRSTHMDTVHQPHANTPVAGGNLPQDRGAASQQEGRGRTGS